MEQRLINASQIFYAYQKPAKTVPATFANAEEAVKVFRDVIMFEAANEMKACSDTVPKNPLHVAVDLETNPGIVSQSKSGLITITRRSSEDVGTNRPPVYRKSHKCNHACEGMAEMEEDASRRKARFLEKRRVRSEKRATRKRGEGKKSAGDCRAQTDDTGREDRSEDAMSVPQRRDIGDPSVVDDSASDAADADAKKQERRHETSPSEFVHPSTDVDNSTSCAADADEKEHGRGHETPPPESVYHSNPVPHLRFLDAMNHIELHPSVRDVLTSRVSDHPMFEIVHGPPGTGKTTHLVTTLKGWLDKNPNSRCLVCSPSNIGVINVYDRCLRSGIRGHLSMSKRHFPADAWINTEVTLRKAQVVFCTICGRWSGKLCDEGFDALFVDEAAQVSESHVFTLLHGVRYVYMTGDPNQLNAQTSVEGQKHRHERSMMERLVRNGFKCDVLKVQKRMHPELFAFPNAHFYDNQLTTAFDGACEQDVRYVLVDVCGKEKKRGTSVYNADEAVAMTRCLDKHEGAVGLVPYTAQQEEVYKSCHARLVHTIDSYQGREADTIVLSITRTTSEGFWTDPARLNVALTRARSKMFIITCVSAWKDTETHLGAMVRDAIARRAVIHS